jgi:hypothetical protein
MHNTGSSSILHPTILVKEGREKGEARWEK